MVEADCGEIPVTDASNRLIGVITDLLLGKWEYQARGVMDITHLRFWTRRSSIKLMAGAGYRTSGTYRNLRWWNPQRMFR